MDLSRQWFRDAVTEAMHKMPGTAYVLDASAMSVTACRTGRVSVHPERPDVIRLTVLAYPPSAPAAEEHELSSDCLFFDLANATVALRNLVTKKTASPDGERR